MCPKPGGALPPFDIMIEPKRSHLSKEPQIVRLMACMVCVVIVWPASGGEKVTKTYLLRGTEGELPSETGDDNTKMSKVKSKELGGAAIEIQLLDTFGQS